MVDNKIVFLRQFSEKHLFDFKICQIFINLSRGEICVANFIPPHLAHWGRFRKVEQQICGLQKKIFLLNPQIEEKHHFVILSAPKKSTSTIFVIQLEEKCHFEGKSKKMSAGQYGCLVFKW